ncbi:MAG TPA: LysR family transcriptional regulator [Pseudomonas sp.]|nr:LysR family transcriptional regulator [Pseudomonas sp.]
MSPAFTLHDLQCFAAVVRHGGFQAAAEQLHRTHPSVFAAVGKLEQQLGIALLDRSGYRVRPTDAGQAFYRKAAALLVEAHELRSYAEQLALGRETQLRVVLGDLCPLTPLLALLSRFFSQQPHTRLHLQFETVTGPWQSLFEERAELIVHRIPKSDGRLEWLDLGRVAMVPVAAPGFLPFPVSPSITPEQLQELTQCIIRDSAQPAPGTDHFLVPGAPQCSVPDMLMKKELILHGLAWGHLPRFLIADELGDGRLLSIAGRHLPGVVEELVVARRRDRPHGPVAIALWQFLASQAPLLAQELGQVPPARSEGA